MVYRLKMATYSDNSSLYALLTHSHILEDTIHLLSCTRFAPGM